MNNCRNCRYWGLLPGDEYTGGDYRRCGRLEADDEHETSYSDAEAARRDDYERLPANPLRRELALLDGNSWDADPGLYCRAAFGCVLWEAL